MPAKNKEGRIFLLDRAKAAQTGTFWLSLFQEEKLVRDLVGGQDLSNPGGFTIDEGGSVATFNGAQQQNKAIVFPSGAEQWDIIVAARIKATAAQEASLGAAFGIYASAGTQTGVGVGFDASNNVGHAFLDSAAAGLRGYSAGALNTYYTVFAQRLSNSNAYGWINGNPATTSQGAAGGSVGTINELSIGAQHRSAGYLRQFKGNIEWAALIYLPKGSASGTNGLMSDEFAKYLYESNYPYSLEAKPSRIWVAGAGGNGTATITGVSGSGQVGTLSPSGTASVSLSGTSGTGSVGSVSASVSVATAITGVSSTGSVGTTTQTGDANVTSPSAAGTGSVGTVSASGSGSPDGNVTITGIAGAGQVGTVAASGNAEVSIAGISGAGSVGSITPSVTVSTTITGVSGTGNVGATTQTGAANTTVSSAVGTGLVGDVSAAGTSQNGNAVITGVSGIGSVGTVSATDGTVVNGHGFIITDTAPRLWWKRKPRKLDDKEAEEKIVKVVRTIERVANSTDPSASKEVLRKAAYAEIAPFLREMPGFNWEPMFRAILTQSKLQQQAKILANQEIERIKRMRDDEEALIVLLMGA